MADGAGGVRVGFLSLLGLLFIGLKLGGAINWSWWWVLAPLWGPAMLGIGILVVFLVLYILAEIALK